MIGTPEPPVTNFVRYFGQKLVMMGSKRAILKTETTSFLVQKCAMKHMGVHRDIGRWRFYPEVQSM